MLFPLLLIRAAATYENAELSKNIEILAKEVEELTKTVHELYKLLSLSQNVGRLNDGGLIFYSHACTPRPSHHNDTQMHPFWRKIPNRN